MKFTAVYWGAFDPPTEAHKAIVHAVLSLELIFDLFIVVNNHNYKSYRYPLEKRLDFMNVLSNSIPHPKKIRVLSQDDKTPLDYSALAKLTPHPLCAVAGYDSYKKWVHNSLPQQRSQYKAIAVIPRGDEEPLLFDSQAFLLKIDPSLKDISSSQTQ